MYIQTIYGLDTLSANMEKHSLSDMRCSSAAVSPSNHQMVPILG